MILLIGNTIALLASLLMVYSGMVKNKKKILNIQNVQMGLLVISDAILGGITGAIINVLGVIRNTLCYYNKFGLKEKIIICVLSAILTIAFNNMGIIGFIPMVAIVVYTWLIGIKNIVSFKILIIFTMVLWGIYDFSIKSYTACAFDMFTILTNVIAIRNIRKK